MPISIDNPIKCTSIHSPSSNLKTLCEYCQENVTLYCKECSNSYCMMCSALRHNLSRSTHHIVCLSELSNHWICIKLNEDKTTVFLYDSKYSSIPHTVVDLITDIIHSEKDTVTIKSMAMQEQQGCNACGVFSLAVATALCNEQDSSILCWKQDAMWQHLLKSLEEERLSPFPVDSKATSSPEKDNESNCYTQFVLHLQEKIQTKR